MPVKYPKGGARISEKASAYLSFFSLGPTVISWKKRSSLSHPGSSGFEYLATGRKRLANDDRITVEDIDETGSTLVKPLKFKGKIVCVPFNI